MTDMLVRLYDLPDPQADQLRLSARGIAVKRALALDSRAILEFVDVHFGTRSPGWVGECQAALMHQPPDCYIAERAGVLLGFACFDATAKGMFGPTGVIESERRCGIGRVLLLCCLHAMAAQGYAYGVIGWVAEQDYYRKAVDAIPIPGSEPGVYRRALGR